MYFCGLVVGIILLRILDLTGMVLGMHLLIKILLALRRQLFRLVKGFSIKMGKELQKLGTKTWLLLELTKLDSFKLTIKIKKT
jgi:hypothetical protein